MTVDPWSPQGLWMVSARRFRRDLSACIEGHEKPRIINTLVTDYLAQVAMREITTMAAAARRDLGITTGEKR